MPVLFVLSFSFLDVNLGQTRAEGANPYLRRVGDLDLVAAEDARVLDVVSHVEIRPHPRAVERGDDPVVQLGPHAPVVPDVFQRDGDLRLLGQREELLDRLAHTVHRAVVGLDVALELLVVTSDELGDVAVGLVELDVVFPRFGHGLDAAAAHGGEHQVEIAVLLPIEAAGESVPQLITRLPAVDDIRVVRQLHLPARGPRDHVDRAGLVARGGVTHVAEDEVDVALGAALDPACGGAGGLDQVELGALAAARRGKTADSAAQASAYSERGNRPSR